MTKLTAEQKAERKALEAAYKAAVASGDTTARTAAWRALVAHRIECKPRTTARFGSRAGKRQQAERRDFRAFA